MRLSKLTLCAALAASAWAGNGSGSAAAGTPGRGPFNVVGNKIYDSTGTQVVFRGFSVSCTEYMARPGFAAPDEEESPNHPGQNQFERRVREAVEKDGKGDWPGKFAWTCFGGASAPNATFQLNNETAFMMKYLLKDTDGGSFITQPTVNKVHFGGSYDEVVSFSSPRVLPIVRIPLTAGTWLYDIDASDILSSGYRYLIDLLITNLTSQGVAVILDMHASCGGSKINCTRSGPMALRNFGNYSGALAFWTNISTTYAANDLVFYELYNEPHVWYQALYGGDPIYAGYADMYDAVRVNAPDALVVIGATNWAYDAAGPLAMYQQYARSHNGTNFRNVLWNMHPYQGAYQGVWNSMRSTMRVVLALQTIGPVIWTELGQYCCNEGPAQPCKKSLACNDHTHGDWFVQNVVNLAAQLDVSWTAWAWRGTNPNDGNCTTGQTLCGYPDIRNIGPDGTGVLTDGSLGGANWSYVWSQYVATPVINVLDTGNLSDINVTAYEIPGFIPRPCIVPYFGQGGNCGWPLGTNTSELNWVSLWNQSLGNSVLPGLPPSGPLSACTLQACPGYTCSEQSGVMPDPRPCGVP